MEKSNVIRCFNEGKHYIETCLEQIVSLEQNDDKEMRIALKGKFMVKVSYKAAENFCKVASYVIDGKDGAQQMKAELICLKEKLVQLYNGADRQNLSTIKHISEVIMDEIKKVEKWTGYKNSGDNSETGEDEVSEDEVGEDEGYRISLPLAMDTESARDIFTAAFNEGWMVGDNTTGYTWKGFGNISKSTGKTVSCSNKLAYLCYKIYESSPPWSEIGKFFNIERLDRDWSNIAYNINNSNRQTWMNTIDNLIRKTLC